MIRATSTYAPRGPLGQFIQAAVTPGVQASVKAATQVIFDESQSLVHVDSGELKGSGRMEFSDTDKTSVGKVIYDSGHADFAEFGTGKRGMDSPMAGPYPYDPNWPGMDPIPYLRPALDTTREAVKEAFASNLALGLR